MRNKSRLTITLPHDILKKVDAIVDRRVIRNRSHAIESLIQKSLGAKITTAVILSGGKNNQITQRSLKKIQDRHLLSITLEHLKNHGISEVIICAGKSNSDIKKIFGNGSDYGVAIYYVNEDEPSGTAGALKKAEKYLRKSPFLVIHGDTLTNLNLSEFIDFHVNEETMATIAVKPRLSEKKYGQVFMQGNKITKFLAAGATQGISIINTGIYIFEPKVLELIENNKVSNLEDDVFPLLAEKKELSAFLFQGLWYDISEKKDYLEAQGRNLVI